MEPEVGEFDDAIGHDWRVVGDLAAVPEIANTTAPGLAPWRQVTGSRQPLNGPAGIGLALGVRPEAAHVAMRYRRALASPKCTCENGPRSTAVEIMIAEVRP